MMMLDAKHTKAGKNSGYIEFPCDLCRNIDAVEVPYARSYTGSQPIYICKHCGFIYVKLRRSFKKIADTWSNELFSNYTAKIPAIKARQLYVADFIDINIGLKNKKVCDIGTGEGQFLDIIRKQYKARVFGIEPSKENCTKLSQMGIRHFSGTIEDYSISRKDKHYKADIVTILWALENCSSCRNMLSGAYQILKNDGYITVATGSRILVPFKKPLHLYLTKNMADTNAFRFSANTLRAILAVSGFEITHINRYLDSDVLCMIAKKRECDKKIGWQGDDFRKVKDFFKRWHKESLFYKVGKKRDYQWK